MARRSWRGLDSIASARRLAPVRPFTMPEHSKPAAKPALRILLADDHATVRHGLKLLVDAEADMKVVAEAADGEETLQKAREAKPDVIVMDISMPRMNGLLATRALKQAQPDAVIVTLTRHGD